MPESACGNWIYPRGCSIGMDDSDLADPSNRFRERKVALVLIDLQNKFAKSSEEMERALAKRMGLINEVSAEFRKSGNPVIAVFYDGEAYCSAGIENPDDPVEGLVLSESDIVVHKTHANSFRDSGLEEAVKGAGCSGVVLAGLISHCCVLSTYFAAYDHDLVPYILRGGTAAAEEDKISGVESLVKTVDLDDIRSNVNFRASQGRSRQFVCRGNRGRLL